MFNSLIIGLVVLFFGLISFLFPPKKINNVYGYKTELSITNLDVWNEGNRYCARQYLIAGAMLTILGYLGYLVFDSKGCVVSLAAFIPVLYFTLFTTEKYLKSIFDSNGIRIED
jgi:uncharacterized membrane protein